MFSTANLGNLWLHSRCYLGFQEGVGAAENLNEMQCMWFQINREWLCICRFCVLRMSFEATNFTSKQPKWQLRYVVRLNRQFGCNMHLQKNFEWNFEEILMMQKCLPVIYPLASSIQALNNLGHVHVQYNV